MALQSLAERLNIKEGEGLQTKRWDHCCSFRFQCVLCGEVEEMNCVSTTLFDGQENLGDLCCTCIDAGPAGAAQRAHDRALSLREWAADLELLGKDLQTLDLARWATLEEQKLIRLK